jgi:hypothetical protein
MISLSSWVPFPSSSASWRSRHPWIWISILLLGIFTLWNPSLKCCEGVASSAGLTRRAPTISKLWRMLTRCPHRVFAQGNAEGVILCLLAAIGTETRFFAEFGYPYSIMRSPPNTLLLRRLGGWEGFALDGDPLWNITRHNSTVAYHNCSTHFITPENICELFRVRNTPMNLDYLSVDIDSRDYWVLRELLLCGYRPRIIQVEYNSHVGIGKAVTYPRNNAKPWVRKSCFYGASLSAFLKLAREFNYYAVNVVLGLDVILVRGDLVRGQPVPELLWKKFTNITVYPNCDGGIDAQPWEKLWNCEL